MNQRDSNRNERAGRIRAFENAPHDHEALAPFSAASTPDPQAGTRDPASSTPQPKPAPADSVDPLARLRQTQTVKPVDESIPVEETPSQPEESKASPLAFPDFKSFLSRRQTEKSTEAAPASDQIPAQSDEKPSRSVRQWKFAPAFWTIASTLSLIVNLILIVIILFLVSYVSQLNLQINQLMTYAKLPEDTVKGLYENFVLMDNAHIRTQIPVSLEVPVKFDISINTQTEVTLSQDTPISQARVTLSTGGLNITNAPANIVLPAGTRLPINLSLVVPVDKTVPVSLVVPVDIALKDTDLHTPFVGLQQVVQPLYCLLNPQATSNAGILLCPPPATP